MYIRICYTLQISRWFPTASCQQCMSLLRVEETRRSICKTFTKITERGAILTVPELIQQFKKHGYVFFVACVSRQVLIVQGVAHGLRANRKLFTMSAISPTSVAYAHISQKLLKAAAARMFLFWITTLVHQSALDNPSLHNKCFGRS